MPGPISKPKTQIPIIIRTLRRICSSFEFNQPLKHTRTLDKISERKLFIAQRELRAPRGKSSLHRTFLQRAALAG
jgi:hypothetical protein